MKNLLEDIVSLVVIVAAFWGIAYFTHMLIYG